MVNLIIMLDKEYEKIDPNVDLAPQLYTFRTNLNVICFEIRKQLPELTTKQFADVVHTYKATLHVVISTRRTSVRGQRQIAHG